MEEQAGEGGGVLERDVQGKDRIKWVGGEKVGKNRAKRR